MGLAGGEPDAPGENWLLPGGEEARAEPLPDKCTTRMRTGDVLRMLDARWRGLGSPACRLGTSLAEVERVTDCYVQPSC